MDSTNFVADSTNFVADSAKSPVFGAISSNTVSKPFARGIQNSNEDRNRNVADSA